MRNQICLFVLVSLFARCKRDNKPDALVLATITTTSVSTITPTMATSGGNITSDGGSVIIERGIVYDTISNPTVTNNKIESTDRNMVFIVNVYGLNVNTKYYLKAYAINSMGISYGNEISFTTSVTLATLSTATVTNITSSTAVSGGNITSDGGSPITERGLCWSINLNPTINNTRSIDGSGTGNFISNLTNLSPGTIYYARAYAKNNVGVAYGNQTNFITPATIATITTTSINNFPGTTANGGGNISNDGGAAITARGVCWGTSPNPITSGLHTTDGTGIGSFNSLIMGLSSNTSYYVRAYATNSVGTVYGNEVSFTSTANTTFFIGQSYGGGIIFYIDGTGQHGYISSLNDQFPGIIWYNGSFVLTNAINNIDGSGNTTQIINVQGLGPGSYAARICREFNGGGFTDWFLPAKDQLNILYNQKTVIGGFAGNVYYWSSTEYDIDNAWMQNFSGGQMNYYTKSSTNYIRAIRFF